jgi:hypothetical protein
MTFSTRFVRAFAKMLPLSITSGYSICFFMFLTAQLTAQTLPQASLIKDIQTGIEPSAPNNFINFNGKTYFRATTNKDSLAKIMVSDGTETGTTVAGCSPTNVETFTNMVLFNNQLYWLAVKSGTVTLWKSTSGATATLVDTIAAAQGDTTFNISPFRYDMVQPFVMNGNLVLSYNKVYTTFNNSYTIRQTFYAYSNGLKGGTINKGIGERDAFGTGTPNVGSIKFYGKNNIFFVNTVTQMGFAVYAIELKSNFNTNSIASITIPYNQSAPPGTNLYGLGVINDNFIGIINDSLYSITASGQKTLLKGGVPFLQLIGQLNNQIYFKINALEIYKTDGTASGTVKIRNNNIPTGYEIKLNDTLYLASADFVNNYELWRIDNSKSDFEKVFSLSGSKANLATYMVSNRIFLSARQGNKYTIYEPNFATQKVKIIGQIDRLSQIGTIQGNNVLMASGDNDQVVATNTNAKGVELRSLSLTPSVSTYPCAGDTTRPFFNTCPNNNITFIKYNLSPSWCYFEPIPRPDAADYCGDIFTDVTAVKGQFLPESEWKNGQPAYTYCQLGTDTVTYWARDLAFNSTKCTFTVNVVAPDPCSSDNIAPTFARCPTDTVIVANQPTVVNWTSPAVSDNCSIPSLALNYQSGFTFPLGTTAVIYTATDTKNNSATCRFNVTVVTSPSCDTDTTKPVINCPANINLSTIDDVAVANWTVPTATDNCGTPSVLGNYNSGSTFPVGVTPVTYTATDAKRNKATCTFTVTVTKKPAPICLTTDDIVGGVGKVTVSNINTAASIVQIFNSNWTSIYNEKLTGVNVTIPNIPAGKYVVRVVVLKEGGVWPNICNVSNDNVVVLDANNTCDADITPPVISGCPTNISVTSSIPTYANWQVPTASDNCGNPSFTSNFNKSTVFPLGTTTVIYTATDLKGNKSTCVFDVTISKSLCDSDRVSPIILNCPSDVTVITNDSSAIATWIPPTATDNCALKSLVGSKTSGQSFPFGTSTVNYTATDSSNNVASCVFFVNIVKEVPNTSGDFCADPTANVVAGQGRITVNGIKTKSAFINIFTANWQGVAYKEATTSSYTFTNIPNGKYIVKVTVLGTGGRWPAVCTVQVDNVTVDASIDPCATDATPPTFTNCPTIINLTTTGTTAIANWAAPTSTDNCGTPSLSSNYNAGFAFPIGTTEVVYTAKDAKNNTATCRFNVVVTRTVTTDSCLRSYSMYGFLAGGNGCQGYINGADVGKLHAYSKNLADGFYLNVFQQEFFSSKISVRNGTRLAPAGISFYGCDTTNWLYFKATGINQSGGTNNSPTEVTNMYVRAKIVATRAAADTLLVETNLAPNTKTWLLKSDIVRTSCQNCFTNDKTPPTINCPTTVLTYTIPGLREQRSEWVARDVNVTATDNCGVTNGVGLAISPAMTYINYGQSYTYTMVAFDSAGNKSAPCIFTVKAQNPPCTYFNGKLPVLSNCPTDIALQVPQGASCATATWTSPTATQTLNTVSIPVTISSNFQSNYCFPIGVTTVTYTATDSCGNVANCSFKVTVTGNVTPPTAYCKSTSNAPWSEWISEVKLGTFTQTSEKTRSERYAVGYSDFTDKIITVKKGDSYPLSILNGLSWSGYQTNLYYRVWIDYNQNKIFDANELVLDKNALSQGVSNTITIPTSAINGIARMRVSVKKDAAATACETFSAGEVEDYSISIETGTVVNCTNDTAPPVFSNVPVDVRVTCANLVPVLTNPIAADNCTAQVTVVFSERYFPDTLFIRTWQATDAAGNRATVSQKIYVYDNIKPIFNTCPSNITLTTTGTTAIATWTVPTATDNCTATPSVFSNYNSGFSFPLGTTAVQYIAEDEKGNRDVCNFNVTVSNGTSTPTCKRYTIQNTNDICGGTWKPYSLKLITNTQTQFLHAEQVTIETNGLTATLKGTFRDPQWKPVQVSIALSGGTTIPPSNSPRMSPCSGNGDGYTYFTAMAGTFVMNGQTLTIANSAALLQIGIGANMQNKIDLGASGYFNLSDGTIGDFGFKMLNETACSGLTPSLAVSQKSILDLEAHTVFDKVELQWVNNTSIKNDYFEVEKADAQGVFKAINTVNETHNDMQLHHYAYADAQPSAGDNFYRIKSVMHDGRVLYSEVKKAVVSDAHDVLIAPNPAQDNFNIYLKKQDNKPTKILIYNSIGKLIQEKNVEMNNNTPLSISSENWSAGTYIIRIQTQGKRELMKKIVITL